MTQVFYYFECLDGEIGNRLLSSKEIARKLYGTEEELTEEELKEIAADYEAELTRHVFEYGREVERTFLRELY